MSEDRYVTIQHASERIDVSTRTIRRLVEDGELVSFKVRNCLRVSAKSLDNYIARQIRLYQDKDAYENSD
jgi:excisionase family DNA binding protein